MNHRSARVNHQLVALFAQLAAAAADDAVKICMCSLVDQLNRRPGGQFCQLDRLVMA